jgi:hypothetical protein
MHELPMRLALVTLLAATGGPALAETVTIDLTFSEKALAELTKRGEGVVVAGYWMGEPAPGATFPDTEIGTIFLLSETVTVHPGPARIVLGSNFAAAPVDQVIVPMLNVNVYTDRWTDEYNLIDCGFLDAPMAELAAEPQAMHCKLIGE